MTPLDTFNLDTTRTGTAVAPPEFAPHPPSPFTPEKLLRLGAIIGEQVTTVFHREEASAKSSQLHI